MRKKRDLMGLVEEGDFAALVDELKGLPPDEVLATLPTIVESIVDVSETIGEVEDATLQILNPLVSFAASEEGVEAGWDDSDIKEMVISCINAIKNSLPESVKVSELVESILEGVDVSDEIVEEIRKEVLQRKKKGEKEGEEDIEVEVEVEGGEGRDVEVEVEFEGDDDGKEKKNGKEEDDDEDGEAKSAGEEFAEWLLSLSEDYIPPEGGELFDVELVDEVKGKAKEFISRLLQEELDLDAELAPIEEALKEIGGVEVKSDEEFKSEIKKHLLSAFSTLWAKSIFVSAPKQGREEERRARQFARNLKLWLQKLEGIEEAGEETQEKPPTEGEKVRVAPFLYSVLMGLVSAICEIAEEVEEDSEVAEKLASIEERVKEIGVALGVDVEKLPFCAISQKVQMLFLKAIEAAVASLEKELR